MKIVKGKLYLSNFGYLPRIEERFGKHQILAAASTYPKGRAGWLPTPELAPSTGLGWLLTNWNRLAGPALARGQLKRRSEWRGRELEDIARFLAGADPEHFTQKWAAAYKRELCAPAATATLRALRARLEAGEDLVLLSWERTAAEGHRGVLGKLFADRGIEVVLLERGGLVWETQAGPRVVEDEGQEELSEALVLEASTVPTPEGELAHRLGVARRVRERLYHRGDDEWFLELGGVCDTQEAPTAIGADQLPNSAEMFQDTPQLGSGWLDYDYLASSHAPTSLTLEGYRAPTGSVVDAIALEIAQGARFEVWMPDLQSVKGGMKNETACPCQW
jgi:hypothetical protein